MSYAAERGAMVVVASEAMLDQQIEISPVGADAERTTSAVHRRVRRNRPPQYTAEYASLVPGSYTVWRRAGGKEPLVTAAVLAGKVTEVTLPGQPKSGTPET